jgi:hypothetical protein
LPSGEKFGSVSRPLPAVRGATQPRPCRHQGWGRGEARTRHALGVPGVPDVTGLRLSEAFDALRAAALQPVLIGLPTAKSDGNLGYSVAAQEPAAGAAVETGTRVALAAHTRALSFGGGIEGPLSPPRERLRRMWSGLN